MKILICSDSFYPGIGGTEAACLGYANELVNLGHNVMLACPDYHKEDERKYNFQVVRIPSISLSANDKMVTLSFAKKQIKLIKDFAPEVVHIETVSGMAKLGLKIARQLNVPAVMTIHTQFRDAFSRSIKSKLIVNCMLKNVAHKLSKADAIITVVKTMKPEIVSWFGKKKIEEDAIITIKNGAMFEKKTYSKEELLEVRKHLNLDSDENVLLFVGRMMKFKNVEFVLNSLKLAKEKNFAFKFLMVGNGQDLPYFKNVAKANNIENEVLFLGEIKDREYISKIYATSDLFVTASKFDTDPIVVVESACVGTPTLSIENSGISTRIIDNVSGYLSSDNEQDFANKLIQIFSGRKRLEKVSNNAREMVPSTWEETAEENLKVYHEVLKKYKQ